MAPVSAYVRIQSPDWTDSWKYTDARPLGDRYVAVTNLRDAPVLLLEVCRGDIGRDFRTIDPPVEVSPGRTAIIDLHGLPVSWPVLDPDLDYKLAVSFDYYNNGTEWRLGTGPDSDYGPLFPRPALGDLP